MWKHERNLISFGKSYLSSPPAMGRRLKLREDTRTMRSRGCLAVSSKRSNPTRHLIIGRFVVAYRAMPYFSCSGFVSDARFVYVGPTRSKGIDDHSAKSFVMAFWALYSKVNVFNDLRVNQLHTCNEKVMRTGCINEYWARARSYTEEQVYNLFCVTVSVCLTSNLF